MISIPDFDFIVFEVRDGVARITINRPEVRNAFCTQAYRELRSAIRLADLEPDVDVIVITGTGDSFATGGDLSELGQYWADRDYLKMYQFNDDTPFVAMRKAKATIIAAVNGVCMGGGLIVAGCCDIIVASDRATFAIPEARIGIAEPMTVAVLGPRVSLSMLRYLIMTGKQIDAMEAERIGITTETVAHDRLEARVEEIIGEIRSTCPRARAAYRMYLDRLMPPFDGTQIMDRFTEMDFSRLDPFMRATRTPSSAPEGPDS